MECPMCGLEFPIIILESHAWKCNGREEPDEGSLTQESTVPSAAACTPDLQQADEEQSASPSGTSEIPHPDTERCQEEDEMPECPLCFRSFPADLIIEHSAFCNGPSCGKLPEQAIRDLIELVSCDHSEPQEQVIGACAQPPGDVVPSCSQELGSSVSTEVTSNIKQVFYSYVSGNNAVVSRETTWSVEPRSRQEDDGTSQNVSTVLRYLDEAQKRLDSDPELNQILDPLLKSSRPLDILMFLIKSIFGKATGKNVTPFAFFFYLAKIFLPRILEVESWTALLKCLDMIIPDVVIPWISRMGGWGVVLALLGSVGGLLVGFTIKHMKQ